MESISTGYKPEFGLGAVYQGINAADAESLNQESIIKAYLANQREQQMQPLDVGIKQWENASAQDKLNDPNYREWLRKGYIGQMKTQDAAGTSAQVLEPFKTKNTQATLENDTRKQGLIKTIQDIDSQLQDGGSRDEQGNLVPHSPQDSQQLQVLRGKIIEGMGTTPEFWQKDQLQNARLDSNEYIAAMKAEAAKKQLQEPKYKEQLASAIRILGDASSSPEDKQRAQEFYQRHLYLVQAANPKSYTPQMDMGSMGVPMTPSPIQQGQGGAAPIGTKPSTTIKYDNKGNRIP